MKKEKQLNIRIDSELYEMAKEKCEREFYMGMSTLIKVFLKAFVSQRGVGFYIGDDDLCQLFHKWLTKKGLRKGRENSSHLPGPRLKDLYELNVK